MTCRDFIVECLRVGILRADSESGTVSGPHGAARSKSARGYIVVSVRSFGVRKQVKAHQVVWLAAGREIPDGLVLDHRDRDKTNNALSNLRLVTQADNAANRRSYSGSGNPAAQITETIASEIREKHRDLRSYSKVAALFSVSRSLVAQIVRGELWTH